MPPRPRAVSRNESAPSIARFARGAPRKSINECHPARVAARARRISAGARAPGPPRARGLCVFLSISGSFIIFFVFKIHFLREPGARRFAIRSLASKAAARARVSRRQLAGSSLQPGARQPRLHFALIQASSVESGVRFSPPAYE